MGSKLSLILLLTTWIIGGWTGRGTAPAANDARRQTIRQPATVVIDDSAFYEQMSKGTIITQARAPAPGAGQQQETGRQPGGGVPPGSWLFRNSGLVMRSQAYPYARADIPDQVIARGGTSLLVYGYKHARPKTGVRRDANYWKRVASHTHY